MEIIQSRRKVPILEWRAEEQKMVKRYKPDDPSDWSGILWPGNGTELPSNSPICGWDGELCVTDENNFLVIIGSSVGIVFIIAVVTLILFRKIM